MATTAADAALARAAEHESASNYGAALDELESAMQDGTEDARLCKQCARLSLKINEVRAFVNWCHEALRIDESDPEPHEMLGRALAARGRTAEAEEEFRIARRLRDDPACGGAVASLPRSIKT
jgi:Flp pilus assembly protein TadD